MSNTHEHETDTLQQIRDLIGDGHTGEALRLLQQVLKHENQNAEAWYLVSQAVENLQHQREALQRALCLDATHADARDSLAAMDAAAVSPVPEAPPLQERAVNAPAAPPPPAEVPAPDALPAPAAPRLHSDMDAALHTATDTAKRVGQNLSAATTKLHEKAQEIPVDEMRESVRKAATSERAQHMREFVGIYRPAFLMLGAAIVGVILWVLLIPFSPLCVYEMGSPILFTIWIPFVLGIAMENQRLSYHNTEVWVAGSTESYLLFLAFMGVLAPFFEIPRQLFFLIRAALNYRQGKLLYRADTGEQVKMG